MPPPSYTHTRSLQDDLNYERRSYSRWPAYGQSKLANILFAKELARRCGVWAPPYDLSEGRWGLTPPARAARLPDGGGREVS